jgi:hypothetical protein
VREIALGNRETRRLPVRQRDVHWLDVGIRRRSLLPARSRARIRARLRGNTRWGRHDDDGSSCWCCKHRTVPRGDVTRDREIAGHRREASFPGARIESKRSPAKTRCRGRASAPERFDRDVLFVRTKGLNRLRA